MVLLSQPEYQYRNRTTFHIVVHEVGYHIIERRRPLKSNFKDNSSKSTGKSISFVVELSSDYSILLGKISINETWTSKSS